MSRSRKKTPKVGFSTSVSEKDDKRRYNRGQRHATKSKLGKNPDSELSSAEHKRSGTWNFAKDGKRWMKKPGAKDMRK